MEDLDNIKKQLDIISRSGPLSGFKKINFLNIKFDFEIDSSHFIEWLHSEFPDEKDFDDYTLNVSGMCEYACLYISMFLDNKKLQSIPKVYYGKFGFWEHYWVGYEFNGKEYFIDLTLKQFIRDCPELSISEASHDIDGYNYLSEGTPIGEYIEEKKAFDFYINPITMKIPKLHNKINDILNIPSYDFSKLVLGDLKL